jgi:hypothetical protein
MKVKMHFQYLFQKTMHEQKYNPKIKILCLCGFKVIHIGLNEITVTLVP